MKQLPNEKITYNDLSNLLDTYEKGKLTKDYFISELFLALVKARGRGFQSGWESRLDFMDRRLSDRKAM